VKKKRLKLNRKRLKARKLNNPAMAEFKVFEKKNNLIIGLLAIIIIAAVSVVIFIGLNKPADPAGLLPAEEEARAQKPSELFNDQISLAVTIENMFEVRPQDGLSRAKLVIEAPVEGGITRFLAFYDGSENLSRIGPIRSARPYFLDWAEEWRALYVHVGGSPEALNLIKKNNIFNLNQFFESWYFWRSARRVAPHNVFSSSELLKQALTDKDWQEPEGFERLIYKDDLGAEDRPDQVNDIVIDYSTEPYRVIWKYDREANSYLRYQGGQPHLDAAGQQLKVKNVLIQFAEMRVIDNEGRRYIKTIDNNIGILYRDGQVMEINWEKKDRSDRTKFYDLTGPEIEFNRGITWIEVVPRDLLNTTSSSLF